jgi:hypothetical protein
MAATVGLWFALPAGPGTEAVRAAIGLLSFAIVGIAIAATARATHGLERTGWRLMALTPVLWLLPAGDLPASVTFCGGAVLAMVGADSLRSRLLRLDMLALTVVSVAVSAAVIGPAIVDRADIHGLALAGALGQVAGQGLAIACVIVMLALTRPTIRPDAWLMALGVLVVSAGSAGVSLRAVDSVLLLRGDVEVLIVVGGVLIGAAALLRRRRPGLAGGEFDDRARALVTFAINATAAVLLGTVWAVTGHLPGALVPAILAMLVLRQVRARLTEREHRELLDVARRSQEELAAQYRASLLALATALEARDGYTGRHGEETVALARRVAEQLGLPADEAVEVEGAALLHDVGKIGTPNEILHKPGPLTDEEWEVMRDHPVVGERILRTVPGLERVARAVRHEHERWDGGGYPDGLAGEEIPLASRIVLVCDAYHAMTSDRPYRRAMGDASARAELVRCAGVQFDPAVVSALLAVLPEPVSVPVEPLPAYQAAR